MGLKVIVYPTTEPVTAAESWKHLRVTLVGSPPAPEDAADIASRLQTARAVAENYTGRSLCPQTLELALDEFPAWEIELPRGPVTSITSVIYVDEDGVAQTLDSSLYTFDDYSDPGWLVPAVDTEWPTTKVVMNAVKIRFEAGYSAPGDSPQTASLPPPVKSAILLILGSLYENRENDAVVQLHEIPYGAECLLRTYRILNGFA